MQNRSDSWRAVRSWISGRGGDIDPNGDLDPSLFRAGLELIESACNKFTRAHFKTAATALETESHELREEIARLANRIEALEREQLAENARPKMLGGWRR